MGADQYIYKTTRKEYSEWESFRKESGIIEKQLEEYQNYLTKKYNLRDGISYDDFKEKITKDELDKLRELTDKYNERIYFDNEDDKEIYYWRKAYGIHDYIRRNLLLTPNEKDNLVRIPLSKPFLENMVKEMERASRNFGTYPDSIFGEHNMWSMETLNESIEVIKHIIENEFTNDAIIYYYAWY